MKTQFGKDNYISTLMAMPLEERLAFIDRFNNATPSEIRAAMVMCAGTDEPTGCADDSIPREVVDILRDIIPPQ